MEAKYKYIFKVMYNAAHELSDFQAQKKVPTPNPKRLHRTRYAGYLDVDPAREYSGFFSATHVPSPETPVQE
jgi:hypothetical protein